MKKTSFVFYISIALVFVFTALVTKNNFIRPSGKEKIIANKSALKEKQKIANSFASKEPKKKEITISAVGDVMFDRRVKVAIITNGPSWPFEKVKHRLGADISIANLESSLAIKGSPTKGKDVVFQGTPLGVKSLRLAGISLVSLANNHALDYGIKSLLQTRENLQKSKIAFAGAGKNKNEAYKPAIIDIGDLRVGFLAFSDVIPLNSFPSEKYPGIAPARDIEKVASKIKAISKKVHVTIVSFHWGVEYENYPTDKQKKLATAAIDAGADLVLGHHPHVTQGVALYKGRLILYSLGNFVFDRYKTKTAQSFIFRVNIDHKGQFSLARIIPVFLSSSGQPSIATGTQANSILSRVKTISGKYSSLLKEEGQTFIIKPINGK